MGPIVLVCRWWANDWKELKDTTICVSISYNGVLGWQAYISVARFGY